MSADDQSQANKAAGNDGEVRPSTDKDAKLEEKIANEKDDEAASLRRSDDDV